MLHRRQMLLSMAGVFPASLLLARDPPASRMGLASYSFNLRMQTERKAGKRGGVGDPLVFLDHCYAMGAGGIQTGLGALDGAACDRLRRQADQYGMYLEGSLGLPQRETDLPRFEANVQAAVRCGATVLRTAMGGRRYEVFDSREKFDAWATSGERAVLRAEPILKHYKVCLAIENHKDRRAAELLAMLKRISSEYVGLCVDLGNDLGLLEDPLTTARAYAPWAKSVHVKDAAVAEYADGFLLADVVLGRGILDLAEMVRLLRQANPAIRFSLEMATRDMPLQVPCLTDKYWTTLGDVPGKDLARILSMVRAKATPIKDLPRAEHLSVEQKIALEQENVVACLVYARDRLGL